MIEGDIRRDMTVDTDQKYQEKVEAAANMICQPKQRYHLNKGIKRWLYQMWRNVFMCLATLC